MGTARSRSGDVPVREGKRERPEITILRHGRVIFEALELDHIKSTGFNKEVKRLDLPDANWNRYRVHSGADYTHPTNGGGAVRAPGEGRR